MLETYYELMSEKAYLDQQLAIIKDEAAEQAEQFAAQFRRNGMSLDEAIQLERDRLFDQLGGEPGTKASDEYGMLEIQNRTYVDITDDNSVLDWLKDRNLWTYIKQEVRKQQFGTFFRTLEEDRRPEGAKLVEKPTLVVTFTREIKKDV